MRLVFISWNRKHLTLSSVQSTFRSLFIRAWGYSWSIFYKQETMILSILRGKSWIVFKLLVLYHTRLHINSRDSPGILYFSWYYFGSLGNGSYPNCNKACGTSTNTQFSTSNWFSRRHQSHTRINIRSLVGSCPRKGLTFIPVREGHPPEQV